MANPSNKWLWMAVGAIALVILSCLCCVGGFAALGGLAVTSILSSEPYVEAVSRAKSNEQVVEALGTPIEEGSFPQGQFNAVNGQKHAAFAISLSGPQGSAVVFVDATEEGATWRYDRFEVVVDGGPTIALTPPAGSLPIDSPALNAPTPDPSAVAPMEAAEPPSADPSEGGDLPASFGVADCDAYVRLACNCRTEVSRAQLCSSARQGFEGWRSTVGVARSAVEQACAAALSSIRPMCE